MDLTGRFWPEVAKERPIVSKVSAEVPTGRGHRTSLTIECSQRDPSGRSSQEAGYERAVPADHSRTWRAPMQWVNRDMLLVIGCW